MSGPYRFQADASRSPLDRRPQNPLPAQPVSFKTNVNRMKTKKWVEAKKNAYDGDDWGEYDEYDEYGASEPDPPPASAQYAAPQAQAYGQGLEQPGRSFTDPQRQGQPQLGRRNSFEAGEEQRAFSASTGQPLPGFYEQHAHQPQQPPPTQYVHPALRQASGAQSDTSDTPEHRRDFSPSAMPPPLQTRMSPPPGSTSGSPSTRYPPRKSSIGQTDSPVATSPRDRAPSNPGKPLPFIRPADIYKRYEEEKERERASLDEQRPRVETAPGQNSAIAQQPALPPVEEGASTFNSDLRSVVDNAFTRADDQRSVPPTPISKSDSGVSRSNTDSTSGISPIMSRVPSSAASAVKARNLAGGDGTTPVIAEEASESGTPVSRPTSAALLGSTHQIPRKASPGHSRNVSNSSDLTTPNATGSPARSPAITPQAHFPEPETAEISSLSQPSDDMKVSSPTDATTREADIAAAMKTSPIEVHAGLSAAEKESQDAFLESHQASTSVAEAFPRSRSESPSKGRVQELAGKFGDVSQSRRGSTQSNASRTSLQSWERSQDNSRPSSPTKSASPSRDNLATRPLAEREASFRPKLPGQWESYATSAETPSKELSTDNLPATNSSLKSPLEEADLTPTTAKHLVASVEPSKSDANAPSIQNFGGILPRPLHLFREESSSSIPPTPPAKDTPESEELPPPPPLKEKSPEARSATTSSVLPERPIMLPQLSTDDAVDDQESDRLRKEIVASLSPQQTMTGSTPEQNPASLHVGTAPVNRESSLFPSEYESYWADGDRTSPRPSHEQGHDRDVQAPSNANNSITANPLTQSPVDATKPAIITRFSWEDGGSGLFSDRLQQTSPPAPEPTTQVDSEEKISSPAVERAAEEQGISQFPEPYFGPTHGVAVVKPEPVSDADLNARSPVVDVPSPSTNISPPETERATSPAPGLHVVNSALNPEAVDLPPRLSREVSPMSDLLPSGPDAYTNESHDQSHDHAQTPVVNPAISAPLHGVQEPTASSPIATTSPISDKPLGFKEILQISSPAERISGYNKTRNYWAHADHGLGDWVSTALSTNPDLATQPYPQPRPTLNTSGTLRHRPTGSISLFGKHHGAASAQGEPAGPSTAQIPVTPTSAPSFPGGGRSASHQMQVKGKDLLHTAGALSGKGLTGAKGLFAKGKSRFKSDKASESPSSSREASEEPSDIGSTTSDFDTLGRPSLDMTDSLKEETKHRRRFSSPFHRSGRSRSRPGSIVLPSIGSTPRSTPGHSRPQSYHPPEAWGTGPCALSTTPERETPEQLGVLPSPAKSMFSLLPQDGDVPPVPPIPETMDHVLSEHVTHRLLQSVIRNSTPPAIETQKLAESPGIAEPLAGMTDRFDNDAGAGHQQLLVDKSGLLDEGGIVESVGKIVPVEPAIEVGRDENNHDALPRQLHHADVGHTGTGRQEVLHDDDWVQVQAVSRSDSESEEDMAPQPHHEPVSHPGTGQQTPQKDQRLDGDSTITDSQLEERPGQLLRYRSASLEDASVKPDEHPVERVKRPINYESDDDLPPQLHHDPLPAKSPQVLLERAADIVAGAAFTDLEISPTLSPIKPHRLSSHENDGRPHLQQPSSAHPQRPALDVSPMLPPAKLVPDISDSSDDEQATPLASVMNANGDGRFSYETELIGGDLSPISSHASSDEERTPTKPDAHSLHITDTTATPVVVTVVDTAQSPRDKAVSGEDALKTTPRPKPQQQLSAYRVVHAVEYLHSQSSFESWEHESTAALSQSDDSPHLDVHDEAEPLASDLSLDNVKAEEAEKAEKASIEEKPTLMAGRDSPNPVVPIQSDTPQEGPQQSPQFGRAGAHKRSESLISKISSMVSAEDASLSPVSSYGPRSRPPSSAAGRQRQIPSAKASPIPVQIEEEPTAPDHAANSSIDNDDFDLYADQNGVVKDEEGRPLRVTTDQPRKPAASARPPTSGAPKPTSLPAPMEEAPGRYSDERPMSFVWGPRDANGRPQDEINRPGGGNQDQSPPRVPNTRVQRSSQLRIAPIVKQKAQDTGTQSNGRLLEQPSQGELGSKNVSPLSSYRESNKSSPHNNVPISPPPVAVAKASSPPPSTISERPHLESPKTSNRQPSPPKSPDPRLIQDPRVMMEAQMQMRGWTPGQPISQDPRLRPSNPAQVHMHGLPQSPPTAPRNQYEYQQMMARQAMQAPELKSSTPPGMHSSKREDKFSIPKFSSVFKGLGKSSANLSQASKPPPLRQQPMQPVPQQMQQVQSKMHPHPNTAADNARRSASLQSGVSDMTPPQMPPTKERRSSAFGLNRPPSFGQESHNSQDSTRVQATGSRLDLRYPASPPPSQGIPPQQPPQHVLQNVQNVPRPQDYQDSSSGVSETSGKKKRFSSLGNIFNRSATSGPSFPTKQKISKEEKKAQKAQKHSSAMPLQSIPHDQPWPPQQPVDPRQHGAIQYGPPPIARPFPGMQGVPLQPMQMQFMQQHAVSPVSPQSMQMQSPMTPQSMHPHGMLQSYTQVPPGFQHPVQGPPSQFAPQLQSPPGALEGSAYMNTRQIAQMMQAQRLQEQSRPTTHHSSHTAHPSIPTASSLPHPAPRPEEAIPPAFNEYFKPDLKMIKPLPPIQPQPEQHTSYHQHPPQPQSHSVVQQPPYNSRSVSAPTTVPSVDQTSHVSQRQVSSPLHEPQYDTPQIPAAYTQVTGAFVSPSLEQGPSRAEESADARSYSRQYSDPLMQPISPQVSAMATSPPNLRQNSSDSVVSPISDPSPGPMTGPSPPPNLRPQKQRMTSITEQVQSERPWNLDLPHGATEQEIVRARQRQYMEQQLAAQEQLHAERTGRSPSPRSGQSQRSASPPPPAPTQAQPPHRESGGFRELLPRSSPQPYPITDEPETQRSQSQEQQLPSPPIAPAPVHPGQSPFFSPAGYPLPMSPDPPNIRSPVNPAASMMPPPPLPAKTPHTPLNASFPDFHTTRPISQDAASDHTHDSLYDPPPPAPAPATSYQLPAHRGQPDYDDLAPADEPPPYSGPGVPHEGMDKDGVRPRPPDIVTDRGRLLEPRLRQTSLGILQHPQPASMAASPQRSSADMGADILRRQLLEVEERERADRMQQAEARRVESERERAERERARARARELERSVSGGGRVGSLRSAQGSTRNSTGGFERGGSTRRAVYELPAEEDDEPVMRATSFPGQEWVPTWTED
ncbi:hypothetical protein DPSP01_005596 [Paraphaeosphaeria sporulosa]